MATENVWQKKASELYQEFSGSPSGLSTREAEERLKRQGQNVIADKDKRAAVSILISQFTSPLVVILIFASLIAAYLGDAFDMMMISAVVAISAILGFVQEYKSEKVLSELKKYYSYSATVVRDNEKKQIDARHLVPGDIVFVGLGDIIPADMRIIETTGIEVDESVLTGESKGGRKNALAMAGAPATPQDIKNGLFMGTTVTGGYAKAIVVSTGERTFFGKTVSVFSSKIPESDFQTGIRKFGSMLVKIILVITVVVFASNYLLGRGENNPFIESLLFALAIAVGITPEALPAIITITLSNGSLALAKKKVVTKKLAAIEDLGNMDILCTDKTGTLTDEIHVERYVDLDKKDSHDVLEYSVLCNAAVGTARIRGNFIDVAIKKYAHHRKTDVSRFTKLQEIPFDFSRRRMGQIVREGKKAMLIVKGAPEAVLAACSHAKTSSTVQRMSKKEAAIKKMIVDYNRQGHTVIAVAYKDVPLKKGYSKEDEKDLVLLGFLLLHNPPKHSVVPTIERLERLGVRLKILTGDDPLVTKKLCNEIGFKPTADCITLGSNLAGLDEKGLAEAVERCDVFARVTPEQKLLIIEALRRNGHVVGFLGDGINDAPSLRTADVGISVNTAADVAKGASHIILLQKSLGVIADGVEEGRKIFGNITKYILNTTSANQGNMITVAASSFFLPFMPLLPYQILLNNLFSDLPLVSVSTDNVDRSYTKKPQRWDIDMILKFMVFFGLISTAYDFLFIGVLQFVMHVDMATFRTAWFLESVLSEMLIVFSLRTHLPFFRSVPSKTLIATTLIAAGLAAGAVYYGPIAGLFQFKAPSAFLLALTAVVLVAYFITTEIGKAFFFSRIAKNNNSTATAQFVTNSQS